MIDAFTIFVILAVASLLLWRQFCRGCGCDTDGPGSSSCEDR